MQLVKFWLAGTVLIVAGALVWSFAPILVPVLGLTLAMGLVVAGIVALARSYERGRGRWRRRE
jgi:hypothetical protein